VQIKADTKQLTIDFEPGLIERHRNLRDCIGSGIYRRGLSSCAIDLNESPGNLSNQLSDESQRKFGVDDFERYLEKTKDYTPIYYLMAKFLHKPEVENSAALQALPEALAALQALMKKAGLS
jgi:hypothetical protein